MWLFRMNCNESYWKLKLAAAITDGVAELLMKTKKQCAYNVTLRRVHKTPIAVEKQYVLHISVRARVHACVWVYWRRRVLSRV